MLKVLGKFVLLKEIVPAKSGGQPPEIEENHFAKFEVALPFESSVFDFVKLLFVDFYRVDRCSFVLATEGTFARWFGRAVPVEAEIVAGGSFEFAHLEALRERLALGCEEAAR